MNLQNEETVNVVKFWNILMNKRKICCNSRNKKHCIKIHVPNYWVIQRTRFIYVDMPIELG